MNDCIKVREVLGFITQMKVRAMKACDYNEESVVFKTANSTLSTVEGFVLKMAQVPSTEPDRKTEPQFDKDINVRSKAEPQTERSE